MVLRPSKKPVVKKGASSKYPSLAKKTKKASSEEKTLSKVSKKANIQKRVLVVEEIEHGSTRIVVKDNTARIATKALPDTVQTQETPEKSNTPTTVGARRPLQLAVLSPFRLPVASQQRLMSTIARSAGIFLVIFGSYFSLLNFPSQDGNFPALSSVSHVGQIISGIIPGVTRTATETVTDSTIVADDTQSGTTPEPRIRLSKNSPISGVLSLTVTVPDARQVSLLAHKKPLEQSIPIGNATQIDATTWRISFDTKPYENGEYQFVLVIRNKYGTYNYTEFVSYTISNTEKDDSDSLGTTIDPVQVTATTTETMGTSTLVDFSTSTPQTYSGVDILLNEKGYVEGTIPVVVTANNASEVKMYARNITTGILYYVSSGKYTTGNSWSINWNTNTVPDGRYTLHANAKINNDTEESPELTVEVKNAMQTNDATTTETHLETLNQDVDQDISMTLPKDDPLSGLVSIGFGGTTTRDIEVYLKKKLAEEPYFLGKAQKVSDNEWVYVWDTEQTPNGEYEIYTRAHNESKVVEANHEEVRIFNDSVPVLTESEENTIDTMRIASHARMRASDGTEEVPTEEDSTSLDQTIYIQSVSTFLETLDATSSIRVTLENTLTQYRLQLNVLLETLARAVREEKQDAIKTTVADIENLKNAVLIDLPNTIQKKEIIDSINSYLSQTTFALTELTTNNEKILKERIGTAVLTDSDTDTVSDFDEVNFYKTNPFTADTDGDGFSDSTEISLGQNPLDSKSTVPMHHESPLDLGVVRDDLLAVTSITTLPSLSENTETVQLPQAVISGKGLPNSYVTLYLYSTPIIVTVKTDSEGSWNYVFNKELENGKHDVYVAITDNTGKIVAKSKPLSFIKTAEAFSLDDAVVAVADTAVEERSLFEGHLLLLVASVSVIALGLVLILLGLYVRGRKEEETTVAVAS